MSKAVFDKLRDLVGGSLSQAQVDAGNRILGFANESTVLVFLGAANTERNISTNGINLIKQFESLRLSAYDDGVGVWTIGYGTTKYPNGQRVKRGDKCTQTEAEVYMQYDLGAFTRAVDKLVVVPITQNQFDALVSFAYNVGERAFENSTLLKKLNAGYYHAAADQLLLWNKAGGKTMKGLINRRAKERELFLS